jgi:hypothetical protein
MRMGRSKSKLVPKSYGPSRRLRRWGKVALLQVIAFGAARGFRRETCASPLGGARHVRLSLAKFGSRDVEVRLADVQPDVVL